MNDLVALQKLISPELNEIKSALTQVFELQKPLINDQQIEVLQGGKLIRPSLMLLVSKMFQADIAEEQSKKLTSLGAAIELLHIASLLHDDIIDKADQRRGAPSFNLSIGTEMALLLGDLQLAESLKLFSDQVDDMKDFGFFRSFIDSGHKICHGQIKEIMVKPETDPNRMIDEYLRIVSNKTGELMGFAAGTGAFVSGADQDQIEKIRNFGISLGIAFQIIDDVLDFTGTTGQYEKSMMQDLYERRLSLPVIYAMIELPNDNILSSVYLTKEASQKQIIEAHRLVLQTDAIKRSYLDAKEYTQTALSQLPDLRSNMYREALIDFAENMLNRTG